MNATELAAGESYLQVNKAVIREFGADFAILLSHMCSCQVYHGEKTDDDYFFQTADQIENRTGLKKHRSRKALTAMKKHKILKVKKYGMPIKTYYQIDNENLSEFMLTLAVRKSDNKSEQTNSLLSENRTTRSPKIGKHSNNNINKNKETPINPLNPAGDEQTPEINKSNKPADNKSTGRARRLWRIKNKTKRKKLAQDPRNVEAALNYILIEPEKPKQILNPILGVYEYETRPKLGLKQLWKACRPQETAWTRAKKNLAKLLKAGEHPEDLRAAGSRYVMSRVFIDEEYNAHVDNPKFAKSIANFFGRDEIYLDYIELNDTWYERNQARLEEEGPQWKIREVDLD